MPGRFLFWLFVHATHSDHIPDGDDCKGNSVETGALLDSCCSLWQRLPIGLALILLLALLVPCRIHKRMGRIVLVLLDSKAKTQEFMQQN